MTAMIWKAKYHNWNNDEVEQYFDNRAYARMFKDSMDARGYLVQLEIAFVETAELKRTIWRKS